MVGELLSIRKRSAVERKALEIIRGKSFEEGHFALFSGGAAIRPFGAPEMAHFASLRECAGRNGLDTLEIDSHYVSAAELLILRWLAEAQRRSGLRTFRFKDIGLLTALRHCAVILEQIGLMLPPRTLALFSRVDPLAPR